MKKINLRSLLKKILPDDTKSLNHHPLSAWAIGSRTKTHVGLSCIVAGVQKCARKVFYIMSTKVTSYVHPRVVSISSLGSQRVEV